jgi:hypothetical protein
MALQHQPDINRTLCEHLQSLSYVQCTNHEPGVSGPALLAPIPSRASAALVPAAMQRCPEPCRAVPFGRRGLRVRAGQGRRVV